MRPLLAVLVITTGVTVAHRAHAESSWSEHGPGVSLRPAEQLVETACELSIELRGAIVEVEAQHRLTNPGPSPLGATLELELPAGAELVGASWQTGKARAEPALAVAARVPTERVMSSGVLGADPLLVTALAPSDRGGPRYRLIVQPLAAEQDVVVATRWLAIAELRDGAIQLTLPGRGERVTPTCRGLVHASPGPGATIERLLLGGATIGARGTAAFELGATDVTLSAVLAFKRPTPVVWTQATTLGDGLTAQAITIATPAPMATPPRRALLVIDGSRSMELVGRHHVKALVRALGAALPPGSSLEAIVFDRAPVRVLNAWRPATPETVAAIEAAVTTHAASNGSDVAAALALARTTLGAPGDAPALVVLVTDGVLGETTSDALVQALGADDRALDLHAIALTPGRMGAPDAEILRAAVDRLGGSVAELAVRDLDRALASAARLLRPTWRGLTLAGAPIAIPAQLRAGDGVVVTRIDRRPTARLTLSGQLDTPHKLAATAAPAVPLAALALAQLAPDALPAATLARLRARHPTVNAEQALAVLTRAGQVAANRRAMVAGGGPYTRLVELADPAFPLERRLPAPVVAGGSALDLTTLKFLFRTQLQPATFACYQRALASNATLAGTVRFRLEIGRGELMRASVVGLGDAAFDRCVTDAAYLVTPPLPNPDYNADDRSLVNYPLTFSVREQRPFVIAGDADSSSPLDIDAIQGGPPDAGARAPVKAVDPSTPLGNLRPSPVP